MPTTDEEDKREEPQSEGLNRITRLDSVYEGYNRYEKEEIERRSSILIDSSSSK